MKLTRQGVRDLNAPGTKARSKRCRHHFGPIEVVDREWRMDPNDYLGYLEAVYGRKCVWCKEVQLCRR